MTKLITSNEKVVDVMKIVKSPKQSLLLTKSVSETNKREEKKYKNTDFSPFYWLH